MQSLGAQHTDCQVHPFTEYGTVISGRFGPGVGATFERTGKEGAIVQIHFVGPGGIAYVNPADDPRKEEN